jgi:uncharacterized membrane protein
MAIDAWCALVVYSIIETLYLSHSGRYVYAPVVARIQGGPAKFGEKMLPAAAFAYLALLGGWWVLVYGGGLSLWKTIVYAVAVYGTFNATSYVMFADWPWWLCLLDTMWGVSAMCITTLVASGVRSAMMMR